MEKKLKIKFDKKHNKISVDYSKIIEKDNLKFAVLSKISSTYDLLFMINTALDMSKNNVSDYRGLDVVLEANYQELAETLKSLGLTHSIRRRPREVNRSVLGVATGMKDVVKDVLIAVAINKGQLSQEVFDLLFRSHDYMLGIDPKKDLESLVQEFEKGDFSSAVETDGFNLTFIDSQWMKYFYTNVERSFFE